MEQLFNLFLSFFKVGALSFGGAYSLIPVIEREVVTNNSWMTQEEFLRVLGLVEVFPGAISIKFATYTGFKEAGILGAIFANLGNMMVPAIIIMVAVWGINFVENRPEFHRIFNGIKYAIIGMILMIMVNYFFKGQFSYKMVIFLLIGIGLTYFKVHPAIIVVIAGILGFFIF